MSDSKDDMIWVTGTFNAAMGEYQNAMYEDADPLFWGRITYKIFESYWPNEETDSKTAPEEIFIAHMINNITKVVFSKTMKNLTWKNSNLLTEINPADIREIKQSPEKNILVIGSTSIVSQLTELGLIDEYHLSLHPVLLGSGKPLFANMHNKYALKLTESKDFGNGVVLLKYAR
jgi:dihydrofolate reductase